jgi:hypothetical protein
LSAEATVEVITVEGWRAKATLRHADSNVQLELSSGKKATLLPGTYVLAARVWNGIAHQEKDEHAEDVALYPLPLVKYVPVQI